MALETSNGATAPVLQRVKTSDLTPHPDNPRRGDIAAIRNSLATFGQMRPIVVRPDGVIVAGKHTWEAVKDLGWSEIDTYVVDLDEQQTKAYLVADNRTSDRASYDDKQLLAVLDDLSGAGALDGTGFSHDEIEDLMAAIEGVVETEAEEFTGGYAEAPEETAARWEGREEGQRREVVFLLLEADFNKFRALVEDLKKVWGKDSMADTIYHAVEESHRIHGELAS